MNLLNLYANGNLLTMSSYPMTTSGSVNYDTCAFNFNSDWKGFERTAVFAVGNDVCFAVELDDTGVCKIPKECLKKTGVLKIGVVGENSDGTVISTNVVTQRIVEGANKDEFEFAPANPETGGNTNTNEDAKHLLWQDDKFRLEPYFILDDYSQTDETDIYSYYNVVFSRLAEKYPTYVTSNVEGQDNVGNDILSFTFAGEDYDRTILITANHFAVNNTVICALGGFFKNLCENYKKDANLNFLHSKVKFVVIPVVCPETFLAKTRQNSNGVAGFVNYDHFFNESPIEDKGVASFSESETIPVLNALYLLSQENCIWHFDFECDNLPERGKAIYYKANDIVCGNELWNMVSKFDSAVEQTDPFYLTWIKESNAPIATNYATYMYLINACTVVWSTAYLSNSSLGDATLKLIDFMGNLFLETAKKCLSVKMDRVQPIMKQIVWKGNKSNNYVELNSVCQPMWVSAYNQRFPGIYGYITVEADAPSVVRVKPVLYQKNSPTDDYASRFATALFDVEAEIPEGKSVIPFSSVLGGKYSNFHNDNICTNIGVVIAAASPQKVKAVSITYTLNAIPSDAKNAIEVLTPTGWASDYTNEGNLPTYQVAHPDMYYDIL